MSGTGKMTVAAVAATALAAGVMVSGASGKSPRPGPDPTDFGTHSNRVTNPWFPLARGSVWVYDGQKDGKQARDVQKVTKKTKLITGIRAVAVSDRLYLNGKLAERTTDWYAQDRKGTVWYLGEATAELNAQGKVTSTEGSFLNGRDGANGGIFMPAHPKVGQSFKQEDFKGEAEDRFRILSLATSVTVPAVSSQDAMLTKETTPLEPGNVDHKYYVLGIGTVREQQVAGAPAATAERSDLVSFTAG